MAIHSVAQRIKVFVTLFIIADMLSLHHDMPVARERPRGELSLEHMGICPFKVTPLWSNYCYKVIKKERNWLV